MAADCNTCGICFLSYNEVERKPLVLPCSHSFCQDCLQQLDALSNKHCPCCRESWQVIAVDNLLFCRQLISPEDSVQPKRCKLEVCEEHGVGMSLWCESCHVPLCIKCFCSEHRRCQFWSIKENKEVLENEFSGSLQKIKKFVLFYEKASSTCADDLTAINVIEKDLAILKQNSNNCKQECDKWLENIKKEVPELKTTSSTPLDERRVSSLKQRSSEIQMPKIPETLLVQVTRAYSATGDDTRLSSIPSFVKNLKNSVKCSVSASSTGSDCEGVDGRPKTPELKENQEWTLRDCNSAAAAIATLNNTSVRPSSVTVRGLINWPLENVEELFKVLARVQCRVILFMFNCFTEISDNSRTATHKIVDLILANDFRCNLVGVWGHLSSADVKRLPEYVDKIGVVLSSKEDMEVVKSVPDPFHQCFTHKIDFVIMQSIQLTDLIFRWSAKRNKKIGSFTIDQRSVALYFPNIVHIGWMVEIMNKIPFLHWVKSLHLPGTTLSPDAVLGVLRDYRLMYCTVHMPFEFSLEYDNEEIQARFKKYGCSIVWDTNCTDCLGFKWDTMRVI